MNFHVGQKVVCVDDGRHVSYRKSGWFERWRKFNRLSHNLNRGDIYTITGIYTQVSCPDDLEYTMLSLAEAWNFDHGKIGFPAYQFRPLVTRKTDI